MIDYALVAGFALALSIVHRMLLIRLHGKWFRQGFAGDAAFHLAVVRELKRTGCYSGVPHFLIQDEPDAYPILFHRFAALLPITWVERWPFLPNAILWSSFATFGAVYSQYVGATFYGLRGPSCGLLFVAIFLSLVSNVSSDMNGLNYISLSERLLSRFFTGLYFCALAVAVTYGDTLSFVLAGIAGAGALTSSMFARQALAFTTPVVSALSLDPRPVYVFALSVVMAAVLDRTYFFRGVRQMVRFWHAYKHHTVLSRYYTLGHSKFVDFRRAFQSGIGLTQRITEFQTKEPTRLLFRFPELFVFLVLIPWHGDKLHVIAAAIVIATLVVYVLTTTKWLRHLGEAIRYVEYNLYILVPVMLAADLSQGHVPISLAACYVAWLGFATLLGFYYWSMLRFPASDQLREALSPVNLQPRNTVYTVPFTLGSAICARFPCRAMMYQGSAVNLDLYEKFMEEIPYLKRDWKPLAAEYGVSHIVAEKSHLRATKDLMGWEYDFSSLPVIAETDLLIVYLVDSHAPARGAGNHHSETLENDDAQIQAIRP